MAKASSEKKVTLVGGNKAHLVNPLGLTKQFKAVCVTDGTVLSPAWRDTKREAQEDAAAHIQREHYIDYDVKIRP